MSTQEGITITKQKDFSEWYNQVVLKAGLADYASVKGFIFVKPYGYAIWESIQDTFNKLIKSTGHQNAYAPALFPERFLSKEKEHVAGFAPEVFKVTHAGSTKLEEPLVLRPTSETVIYDAYAQWVRSYRDLPILWNYWNSVFRAEIKMTKLFVRGCEFLWQEGHTVHATQKEADAEVMMILEFYQKVMEETLAVPVVIGKKTEKEKFAGALYTTCCEAMMPDGKALQVATSHNLGQNFSKAFNITFLDEQQNKQFAWQTSWGFSTRTIGALIMTHGDDKGLVLPPHVAPTQVVIIPIFKEKDKEHVLKEAERVYKQLAGVRAHLDVREHSPGWKFNEWEMKGVPLRLEIGPKDIEKKQVMLVRRDTGAKEAVLVSVLDTKVPEILEDIQRTLLKQARQALKDRTVHAKTYTELQHAIDQQKGFVIAGWCQSRECEEKIKEETGADIRVVPFKTDAGACVKCGKNGVHVYFARAY